MNVSPAFIETARAFGCNRWQTFRRVMLHAAVPFFIAGIRLGLGRALVGVVVAEMFTALSGLGYMVVFYGNTFRTARTVRADRRARGAQHRDHPPHCSL